MDPFAANALNARRADGYVTDEAGGTGVPFAEQDRHQADELRLEAGQRVTSEMSNNQLAQLMRLDGMAAEGEGQARE